MDEIAVPEHDLALLPLDDVLTGYVGELHIDRTLVLIVDTIALVAARHHQ